MNNSSLYGNVKPSPTIQQNVNGEWITILENVGYTGWQAYLKRMADNPNYRAIDENGDIISNPSDRLDNCEAE